MNEAHFDVELTESAEDDLEAIHDYIADNRSVDAAEALLDAFIDKVSTLERYPERGNVPKELEALGVREFRQVLLDAYRLVYRVSGEKVFILLIADGRRDMQALLERRLLGR